MANTGLGNHPLISSWFTPKYNYPHNSLHLLRQSVGIESNTADNSIWSDFFFDAASAATVTGTVALAQAGQTLRVIGSESFTAIVSLSQASQSLRVVGNETFSATVITNQAAQSLAVSDAVTISGTAALNQAAQSILAQGEAASLPVSAFDPYFRQTPPIAFFLPSTEIPVQRQRRRGQIGSVQAPQAVSAQGYIMIMGSAGTDNTQEVKAVGHKNTYARDVKALLELLELEAA